MIDTIRLSSPALTDGDADLIEQACVRRMAVEIATGDVQYSLTSGSLLGSWDSRVSVRVDREVWQSTPKQAVRDGRGHRILSTTSKVPCEPFLTVEGSVHKALLGHNVYGGPVEPLAACRWFVDNVGKRLGLTLRSADDWHVERLDWAEAFELPSFEACEEFVSGLNMAQFPRRQVQRWGSESLMAAGRTTAVKIYHKGPEFLAHDRRRLLAAGVDEPEVLNLQLRANRILRFETEIKPRKLADDFGRKPLACEVTQHYCESTHDREVARLIKEASIDVETVRTHQEVSRRLQATYKDGSLADTLFGTWMQLAALGEEEVRRNIPKSTWYWRKRRLLDAGVSWNGADVYVRRHSAIPAGFSPVRSDPRRLLDQADEVIRQLYHEYERPLPK